MYPPLWLAVVGLTFLMALTPGVWAQRPYIGFVYPAGGQQGATVQIRLGGQGMEQVSAILISGTGVPSDPASVTGGWTTRRSIC